MRPDPPLFVYDGDCGFCKRWAHWLKRRLPPETTFVPSQQIDDLASYGLTTDQVSAASYWVDADGTPHGGAASFAHALRLARRPWSVVGAALRAPVIRVVANRTYEVIARNRHQLPAPRDQ